MKREKGEEEEERERNFKPVTVLSPDGQFCHLGLTRGTANHLLFLGVLTPLEVDLVTGQYLPQ